MLGIQEPSFVWNCILFGPQKVWARAVLHVLQYLEWMFSCVGHVCMESLFECFTPFRAKLHNVVPVELVMSDSVIACIYSLHLLRRVRILGFV